MKLCGRIHSGASKGNGRQGGNEEKAEKGWEGDRSGRDAGDQPSMVCARGGGGGAHLLPRSEGRTRAPSTMVKAAMPPSTRFWISRKGSAKRKQGGESGPTAGKGAGPRPSYSKKERHGGSRRDSRDNKSRAGGQSWIGMKRFAGRAFKVSVPVGPALSRHTFGFRRGEAGGGQRQCVCIAGANKRGEEAVDARRAEDLTQRRTTEKLEMIPAEREEARADRGWFERGSRGGAHRGRFHEGLAMLAPQPQLGREGGAELSGAEKVGKAQQRQGEHRGGRGASGARHRRGRGRVLCHLDGRVYNL